MRQPILALAPDPSASLHLSTLLIVFVTTHSNLWLNVSLALPGLARARTIGKQPGLKRCVCYCLPQNRMSFSDTSSVRSDRTDASVITMSGMSGNTKFISPGTVTQTGFFGTVKHYKEGTCIHGGFFGTTKYVTSDGMRSPYVTPTSSPDPQAIPGETPPNMKLQ